MHGGAFDAGDFTFGQFHDGGVEATLGGPAQVHAQEDVGPVLGFGAAGTGLDVQVGVVHVHLAAEHATELELGQGFFQAFEHLDDIVDGAFVALFNGHVEQLARVGQTAGHLVQGLDDLCQRRALAAQFLGVFGLVPDVRVFEFAVDFDQALMLLIVVKDTPEWTRSARSGP